MNRSAKWIRIFAGGYISLAFDVLFVWFLQEHLGWTIPFLAFSAGAMILAFVLYFVAAGFDEIAKDRSETMTEPGGTTGTVALVNQSTEAR